MAKLDELRVQIKTDPFIDGKRCKAIASATHTSLNPADQEPIATFALAGAKDMQRAVQAARQAFDSGPWPRMATKERVKILNRFAELIQANATQLGTIEACNVGKLLKECIDHDVARASANIRFFASAVQQQGDETFFNDANFLGKKIKTISVTKRYPIGVAGLIAPWNSPLMLSTWKLGPCLATGNCCVLKPSPWALLSVLQLGELANEAGIPPGVLNIVPGDAEGGKALVTDPLVDRISFTGSVPVGKAIAQANAATRVAPISLELGGKSPTVVFADADLDFAAKGVARGIFRSQGQSCVAGSRLLLQDSVYDAFMQRLLKETESMKIGSQFDPESNIGPLITKQHLEKVEGFIATAIDAGAKLTTGGKRPDDPKLSQGNFLEPTIFEKVTTEMNIWQEEVFGPVLVVMPFGTTEEAIALANDSRFGLSSSVWTTNLERALAVANAIEAGMVWINSHFVRDLRAPFGGVKESGIGSEGGRYSLEFFTQPKMICLPYPVESC